MKHDRDFGVRPSAKDRMKAPEEQEEESLPFYRFYGIRRWIRPWKEKLGLLVGRACVFLLFAAYVAIVGLVAVGFFVYFPEMWIKLVVGILIAVFLVVYLTRDRRRRKKFCRRLKEACREAEAQLFVRPKFIRSPKWQKNHEDFRIEVGLRVFYVQYLSVGKYNSSVYLEREGEIKLVHRPMNNKFTTIFNKQPKVTVLSTDMKTPALDGRRVIRALVVDPECQKIFCVQRDGGYEATGNGGVCFGMTLYTAKGFFDAIRYDDMPKKKSYSYI